MPHSLVDKHDQAVRAYPDVEADFNPGWAHDTASVTVGPALHRDEARSELVDGTVDAARFVVHYQDTDVITEASS